MTVQSTLSATCSKKAAPPPFSSPLKISRTRSDVMVIYISPLFCVPSEGPSAPFARLGFRCCAGLADPDTAEQFREVPDSDAFEGAHGVPDLLRQLRIGAACHKPVELLDGVVPRKRMRREAWKILNLMFDHFAVLQPDGDFGGIFPGYWSVNSWSGRTDTFFRSCCTSAFAMRSGSNCAGITSPSRRATASR